MLQKTTMLKFILPFFFLFFSLFPSLTETIPSLASSQAEAQQTQSLLSAAAREESSCQQEALHGFCRPGEGI